VLKRARHIANIGGRAKQNAVRLEDVDRCGRQGRADIHLDVLDLISPRAADCRLEHLLQGGRGCVVNDQQGRHQR
jgi:hypothetical protein